MAYIVLVGVFLGVILPIWSKWGLVVPVVAYTRGRVKRVVPDQVLGEWVMKKKAKVFLTKRLLHMPRMPSLMR